MDSGVLPTVDAGGRPPSPAWGAPIELSTPIGADWANVRGPIVGDDTSLYWPEVNGIGSVPKAGGVEARIALTSINPEQQKPLAVDDTNIYFCSYLGASGKNQIISMPKSGGATTVVVDNQVCESLAIDATNIYWLNCPPPPPSPATSAACTVWTATKAGLNAHKIAGGGDLGGLADHGGDLLAVGPNATLFWSTGRATGTVTELKAPYDYSSGSYDGAQFGVANWVVTGLAVDANGACASGTYSTGASTGGGVVSPPRADSSSTAALSTWRRTRSWVVRTCQSS